MGLPNLTDMYNTELTPEQEQAFRDYMATQSLVAPSQVASSSMNTGRDYTRDLANFDMRRWWLENYMQPMAPGGSHFTDIGKKPNHDSFSDESTWHGVDGRQGGHWGGNGETYTPSQQMLENPARVEELKDYFDRWEPNTKLIVEVLRRAMKEDDGTR